MKAARFVQAPLVIIACSAVLVYAQSVLSTAQKAAIEKKTASVSKSEKAMIDLEEVEALPQLRGRPAQLPVIIYSFPPDAPNGPQALPVAVFLEKKEDTDRLKELVAQVLGRPATRLKSAG